ncbi:MAG: penicillin-binding protein activator, partial [Pseudomonadota bacterium]
MMLTNTPRCARAWPARFLLLATLVAALAGCQTTGTTRPGSDLDRAQRYAQQGRYDDAAELYERLANVERGERRDALLLDAARTWLEGGRLTRATNAADQVSGGAANNDRALRLLDAFRALRDGNPDAALQELARQRQAVPPRYLGLWYELRGRAFFQTGDVHRAVTALVERELWLNTSEAIAANREVIWRALQAVAQKGATFDIPDGADDVTAGWLALGQANASGALNPLGKAAALADWQAAYPNHPGTPFIARMNETPVMSFGYPDTVAVLLPLSGRFAGTAAAVRDGLLAAYLADDQQIGRPALRFYDTSTLDAPALLERAAADGARLAIGPLLKNQVDAVASSPLTMPV